ncbi:hypothetical protein [Vibrio sp. D431a]|uniref:hypothetical protein n=1 Tax=Vibrio sp. D431a TaxID=2837388 RepID=UPI0025542EC7|nr:hypothetical protein [Vibrio sp. D431a]MDK9790669.1 hypothetical protein [Vibrio sp. D431a]
MSELREAIFSVIDNLDLDDKEELIDKFDTVACSVNSLNWVSIEGDDDFSDMSNSPEIPLLGDYGE